MSNQLHTSDSRILDRRTLEHDHSLLAAILRPGMRVLDVGCGTGAITAGIARAVGPQGFVLGIDRDAALLEQGRARCADLPNLTLQEQDVSSFAAEQQFDVATAARVLQWIGNPARALNRMVRAVRPGGLIMVLDYNHARNCWEPEPPTEFQHFYRGYLDWRAANGWDSNMGDRLATLFADAGLGQTVVHPADEITRRGDAHFGEASQIWSYCVESIGPRIVAAGYLTEDERLATASVFGKWCRKEMQSQTLVLRVTEGRVP